MAVLESGRRSQDLIPVITIGTTVTLLLLAMAGCERSGADTASETSNTYDATEVQSSASENTAATTQSASSAPTTAPDEPVADVEDQPLDAAAMKKQLETDAVRLWDARVKEDWAIVFEYQTLEDETIDAEQFAQWSSESEPFVIQAYEIDEISVEGKFGWATVDFDSKIRQFPNAAPKKSRRDEKWIFTDNKWKLIPPTQYANFPPPPHARDLEAEKVLRKRFEESWQARVDQDWAKLYQLSDPRDHDKIAEHELAEAKAMVIYLSRTIDWIAVQGDHGTVMVAIEHRVNDPNLTKLPPRVVVKDERWIRLDGQWYMDLRPEGAE